MDFAYYERLVDKMLKPARAFHSKEVAKEARELALLYGADLNKRIWPGCCMIL